MNRRFPSDFFFPQKEQTGSKSEPGPDRFQDTDPGMEAFAERARIELRATGEHARTRTVDTVDS